MTEAMDTLKQWVDESGNIVFFGGAGVSTESGIPDFRSVDGLYHQKYDYPPETILSHSFYKSNPKEFWRFYRDKMLCLDAKPNAAHLKLAELERAGIPYDDLPLYDTVYESAQSMVGAAMLDAGEVDYVAFTSASTVQGFVRAIGARDYSGIRAACIGEATARAAQACGMQVVVAEQATMQSLVQLMTEQTGNKEEPVDG